MIEIARAALGICAAPRGRVTFYRLVVRLKQSVVEFLCGRRTRAPSLLSEKTSTGGVLEFALSPRVVGRRLSGHGQQYHNGHLCCQQSCEFCQCKQAYRRNTCQQTSASVASTAREAAFEAGCRHSRPATAASGTGIHDSPSYRLRSTASAPESRRRARSITSMRAVSTAS